jgi:hypothetical protein
MNPFVSTALNYQFSGSGDQDGDPGRTNRVEYHVVVAEVRVGAASVDDQVGWRSGRRDDGRPECSILHWEL